MLGELRTGLGRLGRPHTIAGVTTVMRSMGLVVTNMALRQATDQLCRDSAEAGPLEELLYEPGVSDMLINGPDAVFVGHDAGLEVMDVQFVHDEAVRRLAIWLAATAGGHLDDAQPFIDGRLSGEVRLHMVLAPLASPRTYVSLRVPASQALTLGELHTTGSLTDEALELCRRAIARKVSFLISGGTGTDKTTLLAALLAEVLATEQIVVVEGARKLTPRHPYCVRMEDRPPSNEGKGAIILTTLVRQAFKVRPDRVVLGEVCGAGLIDPLSALNTEHEGGYGTVHASSVVDVPARLETLAALGGLGRGACHAQLAATLRLVLHLRRGPDRKCWLTKVGTFRWGTNGLIGIVPAMTFTGGTAAWGPGADLVRDWLEWSRHWSAWCFSPSRLRWSPGRNRIWNDQDYQSAAGRDVAAQLS